MEILSTWQFWVGIVVAFFLVFIVWIICAAGSKRSRAEERMEDSSLDGQFIKLLEEAKRHGVGENEFIDNVLERYKRVPEIEIANQNNPRTD